MPAADIPPRRFRRWPGVALYAAVGLAGLGMAFLPTIGSRFALIQMDEHDPMVVHYYLEHGFHALFDPSYPWTFWSPPFFAPARDALAYGENMLGALPLYALFRCACAPGLAFQLWMIAAAALTFVSFALVLGRLGVAPPVGALAAFVFSFGMPRLAQLNHPQLLPELFAAPALYVSWRFASSPRRARLSALLALLYLQALCGIYLGWFLLLATAVFLAAVFAVSRPSRLRVLAFLRAHAIFSLASLAAWAGAMVATFRPYLDAARRVPPRPWSEITMLLPRLWSWIAAPAGSLYARWLHPPAGATDPWEHLLFTGFAAWAFAALALLALRERLVEGPRRTLVAASLLAFGVLFLLSLRLPLALTDPLLSRFHARGEVVSLWRMVYDWAPGGGAIRAISRIWVAADLVLFLGSAVGASAWLRARRAGTAAGAMLLAAGMAESFVPGQAAFRKDVFFAHVAREAARIRSGCPVAYFDIDPTRPFYDSQIVAMWAGLESRVPVVNGYTGTVPPAYPAPERTLTDGELRRWIGAPHGEVCVAPNGGAPVRRLRW